MKASELTWGLKSVEIEAPALWGARCILEEWTARRETVMRRRLDVVWDRQGAQGDESARSALLDALNDGGALDALREHFKSDRDDPEDVITHATFAGVLFTYRLRGGYVYVTARLA